MKSAADGASGKSGCSNDRPSAVIPVMQKPTTIIA
jgi:hypothetical protein